MIGFRIHALALGILLSITGFAEAGSIAEDVLEACQEDQAKYCSQVTLGEGRLLACFYAHQDKLSPSCEYGLYEASARLDRIVSALSYVATECRSELETYCAQIEIGEGRVAQCLESQRSNLGSSCIRAMQDTDLMQ